MNDDEWAARLEEAAQRTREITASRRSSALRASKPPTHHSTGKVWCPRCLIYVERATVCPARVILPESG